MITDRQLTPWANLLKVHLQEFRPKQYQSLVQEGRSNDYVQGIVDRVKVEFSDLMDQGLTYHQALEFFQDQLYPKPE